MIKSILEDRFMRGLTAGLMGGIVGIAWNAFSHFILHFSTLMWGDFIAGFVFRRKPENTWETALGMIMVFLFLGFLGMIFAYLIPHIKSKFLPIKCCVFAVALWFAIYSATIMFRIPSLVEIPSKTALSNLIGACIWAISMGYSFNLLEQWKKRVS